MLGKENKMVTEVKFETCKKDKTLIALKKSLQIDNKTIHTDPTVLFLRLIFLIERGEDTMISF